MEFMNRGGRQNQPVGTPVTNAAGTPVPTNGGSHKKGLKGFGGLKLAAVALLFSATILIVALLWFVVLGSPNSEGQHVDTKRMQAVFLNGGQVYFGHIKDLNNQALRVTDIYYLRVNQQVQPDQQATAADTTASANDISLVKLGCELHGPQDEMLINREQVIFWENLKDDGQVAKAVDEYKKQNPNGQNCDQSQQSTTNTDTTAPDTTTTTPTTTGTTKKQ